MRRALLLFAALAGALASAASTGACSLIFSVSDWDSRYGSDAGPGSDAGGGGAGPGSDAGDAGSCSAHTADCDGNPANGCETDLLTSLANCGTCGHACLPSSSCGNGRCAAAPLVPPSGAGPTAIACAPGWVYWTSADALLQVPVTGGPSCTCVAALAEPTNLAVAAGHVVWIGYSAATGRHVYTIPDHDCCAAGPPSTPVLVGVAAAAFKVSGVSGGLVTDGTNAYWLDASHAVQAPLVPVLDDAGSPESLTLTTVAAGATSGIAVEGTTVLVNSYNTAALLVAPVGTMSVEPETIPDFFRGEGVQANATYAIWALLNAAGQSDIRLMPIATLTPRTLATGLTTPTGLAMDAQFVYATDGADYTVSRWSIDDPDAGATVLEKTTAYISDLCADTESLYWITQSGALMKGDKTPP